MVLCEKEKAGSATGLPVGHPLFNSKKPAGGFELISHLFAREGF
jgi:hypothetical protein